VRCTPSGTPFSDLHAVLHAWQPMQRDWSSTFAQRRRGIGSLIPVAPVHDADRVFARTILDY
jgi:hypothetical protein